MSLDHHLATYGTLAPGRSNHHHLSELRGEWSIGTVRGKFVDKGWGATLGYPALVLDADGDTIEVHISDRRTFRNIGAASTILREASIVALPFKLRRTTVSSMRGFT